MTTFPVIDPALWVRWLAAAALLLWLPGHLLAGRWLRELDRPSRIVVSIAAGLLLVPLIGLLFARLGIALVPWTHLPVALLMAWSIGRSRAHRAMIAAAGAGLPALDRRAQAVALGCVVLGATLLVAGLHDFVAPPHVHDASNHAFLTLRTVQARTLDPHALFAGEAGRPDVLYLAGWHAAAGLIARTGGVAPHHSTWLMALAGVLLLPLSLSVAWRAWRLPTIAVAVGMVFVVGNQLVPTGVLGWGGFGQILGFFLVPPLLLAVRAVVLRPSWRAGVLTGLAAGSLVQIHASELVVVAMVLGPVLAVRDAARTHHGRGAHARAWALVLTTAVVSSGPLVWQLGEDYVAVSMAMGPGLSLGDALGRLAAAGGKPLGMQLLAVCGLALALRHRPTRAVAAWSLALGCFYVALATWRDPLTRWLAAPFYQQAPRVLYLQIFALPPLMVLPLIAVQARVRASERLRPIAWGVAVLLGLGALLPALPGVVRNLRNMSATVPFDPDAHWMALQVAKIVGPDEVVANLWDDGSTWAMHSSGRRFLQPCSWELHDGAGSLRPRVMGLFEDPWPEPTRGLRARGVAYFWVSDVVWPRGTEPAGRRAALDADPRFEAVLRGADVTLYRIHWERGWAHGRGEDAGS